MIKRDAFLYLDPKGKKDQFAQCSSCIMWTGPKGNTCTIHGKTKVTGDMSCGLYVHGPIHDDMIGQEMAAVTPKESGLLKESVRCENCAHFEAGENECELFEELNEMDPKKWDLDPQVDPKGCCNAWSKADKKVKSIGDLKKRRGY